MAAFPVDGNITANGDFDIKVSGDIRFNVIITGDFGGGTVTVKEQQPFKPTQFAPVSTVSPITSDFTDVLLIRSGATVRFSLVGATNPDLFIHITALTNG